MALIVQKFGGTSLAEPASRELLASKVIKTLEAGDKPILVVSAMGRKGDPYATDTLLDLLDQYPSGADGLNRDLMASCGEIISACLIAALLNTKGIKAEPMTASSAGISATGEFMDANPGDIDPSKLRKVLEEGIIPVVTGFQGMDALGRVLTLGRGGSDTSAVAIAGALGADFVDIYKDVPGVAKADPRLIPQATFMEFLDYDSMVRLARHGVRVLHDKSAELARKLGMRIRVRSTFDDGLGTLIGPKDSPTVATSFLGLSSSPSKDGAMRLVAVFAEGRGAEGCRIAQSYANAWEGVVNSTETGDTDACGFILPRETYKEFAKGFFDLLESGLGGR
jgi:aspartate kinase